MPKFDSDRLGKTAAGDAPELCVTLVQGNGTSPITLNPGGVNPKAARRDGLVAVWQTPAQGGSASWTDRTKTANIALGGSLTPGADVGDSQMMIVWYHFEG